jgi:uncharacterized protein (TIGR02594 family)
MNTREIQQALLEKGFNPGQIDGVRGRMTIRAVKAFQAANNLEVDGIVGPKTAAALFGGKPPTKSTTPVSLDLPWYAEAWRLIGVDEDTGSGSNKMILAWAKDLGIAYGDDEIPWCGLFVAHCIGSQLPDEPLPGNPLGARNWARFGDNVAPQTGAVMVFWRKSPASGLGHVGFYAGEDATHYHILGGNQSNTVSVTRVPKDRFVESRWPKTGGAATGKKNFVSDEGRPVTDGNEQ